MGEATRRRGGAAGTTRLGRVLADGLVVCLTTLAAGCDRLAGEAVDRPALEALGESPEASWEFLGDDRLRAEVLFGVYNDGGAAAGAVLRAGLHDHVAASSDADLLADARDRFDAITELVFDQDEAGWFVFGRGDQLSAGAREGLAWAMLPHLDSIAVDLSRHSDPTERVHWERTLTKVLADDAGAGVLARGFGVHVAAQYAAGAAEAGQTPGGEADWARRFILPSDRVRALAQLFIDAEGLAVGEQAARAAFFVTAGEAAAKTAVAVGVAASPLSAGQSIGVDGGTSFVIGELVEGIPVPTYDARAAVHEPRDGFQLAALRAVAADDDLSRRLGVDPATRARLADEAFIDAILRGDAAAWEEFKEEILDDNKKLLQWAVDIHNDTMGPITRPIPAGQ